MTPARALAAVRIALGAIFLVRTTRLYVHAPLLGWPDGKFHIALFALPAALVVALAIVRTAAAIAFMLGVRARLAGIVASVCAYIVLAQDALAYVNTLHLLFLSTFIVALTDSASELALFREPARSMTSSVWLVRAVPLSVYFFSGVAKLNAQFLSGKALLGFCADGFVHGRIAALACGARAHDLSIAVVIAELSLPVLLALPRMRAVALGVAIAFHATLEIAMHPDLFGWIMVALLVAFIPGLRRARDRSRT